MESSSEDSFLWTDASSNSPDDIMGERKHKRNSGVKSESDDQLQGKVHNSDKHSDTSYELQENAQEVCVKKETSITEERKKKRKIKSEPESDVDVPKKKKKAVVNDVSDNELQKSDSYDSSYLHTKVKEEMFALPSTLKQSAKIKKKRSQNENQADDIKESPSTAMINNTSQDVNEHQSLEVQDSEESSYSKPKRKKKKFKKKYSSDDEHSDLIEDKFTAEETVVGHQQQVHETDTNLTSINKKHNSILGQSDTFQEDSEDSCDDISAIKGDEDHSSLLIANKDIDNDIIKKKSRSSDYEKSTNDGNVSKLSEYKPRPQRISDRIRFEDEDELSQTIYTDNYTDMPLRKKSNKVNQHLKINTHLKPLTLQLNSSNIITKNDEIWLLKCPKDINISAFKDIILKKEGKSKIKISGQSYDGVIKEEESGRITVLSMEDNQYQLKNLPLSGTIKLKKRIPKPHFHEDNVMVNNQTNFIPLPETKCRHPLFGSNYKKALKIPSAIADRLNAQNNDNCPFNHPEKRKKKKHKKDKSMAIDPESYTEATEEESLKPEPETSTGIREKKKKRKIFVEDECSAPKKKRIKHDPESAEAWESEKTIEENLFNF